MTRPEADRDHQPDYRQPHTHDPRCRGGWIGGRNTDTPRPCLTCKPWLSRAAHPRRRTPPERNEHPMTHPTDPTDDNRWPDDFGDDTWWGGSSDPR